MYSSLIYLFCFVPFLSSCYEKVTVALYFGRIRLGVVHFQVFRLFLSLLTTEFAACSKPPSRDNHREPRSRGRDHTVAVKTAL